MALQSRGFCGIGLLRPKYVKNVGGALRAAFAFDVSYVAIQGDRTSPLSSEDTTKAWRHIPVVRAPDLLSVIPYDAVPVAVDLLEGATDLPSYVHPERALYIFGPEDGTLGASIVDRCRDRVAVPTRTCLNLAATVNIVLYDRMAKRVCAARPAAAQQRGP